MIFKDRKEAGEKLAEKLRGYKGENVIVYALPRGGVPLGIEVAKSLGARLDLAIPRKIGHPLQPEYAVCAVSERGDLVCNEREKAGLDKKWLDEQIKKERKESKRRRQKYMGGHFELPGEDTTAILIDDGIATGLTMKAAIAGMKKLNPKKIIVAVPVLPKEVAEELKREVDDVVALDIPKFYMGAVGAYYRNFPQLEDEEVIKLLASST